MATIKFNMIITDEAVTYARFASTNPGWSLTPLKWAISTSSGELTTSRTTASMYTPWITQPFSGVFPSGTNQLLHSIVIPPDAYATDMNIGEIYFIYHDYYGNEFLYAIAQPTTSLMFTVGISQSYTFVFTLNNTTVADTYTIDYTYPQDIEDHNRKPDSHDYLLARDGSRTATAPLVYDSKKEFTQPQQIVDKEYVDNIKNQINYDINTSYCPPGSMMWWPQTKPPKGWLVRDGAAYSRTTYKNLYDIIGILYGSGDGSSTFNVPDDRGIFIRGYQAEVTAAFGKKQNGGLPNITGTTAVSNDFNGYPHVFTGAFKWGWNDGSAWCANDRDGRSVARIDFNAARSNPLYGAANEVRPINRNYLPIIKY